MSTSTRIKRFIPASLVVFPVAAFTVAWSTASVRDDLGVANIALALAVITVTAGFVRWHTGILTSAVAAGSLTYFHTEPVHSLRMSSGTDVTMVLLLALIGLTTSAFTALRVRDSLHGFVAHTTETSKTSLRQELDRPTPAVQAWTFAVNALGDEITAADVRLAEAAPSGMPVISRRTTAPTGNDDVFVLPQTGAVAYFADPRIDKALIVSPRAGMGAISVNRDALFAFIQNIELALR